MAMRDPKEMAREWMAREGPYPGCYGEEAADKLETLIREAQEDGASGAREDLCDRLNRIEELEAQVAALTQGAEGLGKTLLRVLDEKKADCDMLMSQVAALTERAERAEREAQEMRDAKRIGAEEAMHRVCPACGW